MKTQELAKRVRFAPSPTGQLHLGTARTALLNWLLAKSGGGELILRFDDTDVERSSKEFEQSLIEDLKWLRIDDFAEIVYQSKRINNHLAALEALKSKGCAYERDGAWYFSVPDRPVVFDDLLRGKIEVPPGSLQDFVLCRSDGSPTYNFATAVDDLELAISCVLRGEDHITNTSLQTLVIDALGGDLPAYIHLPLLLGSDGSKLSKRHGATSVAEYCQAGFVPEAIVNYLALISVSYGEEEVMSCDQLVDQFKLEKIHTSAAHFDIEKLRWLSGQQIRNLPLQLFAERLQPWLQSGRLNDAGLEAAQSAGATLADCAAAATPLLSAPELLAPDGRSALAADGATSAVEALAKRLSDRQLSLEHAQELLKEVREEMKEAGTAPKVAMKAIRAKLTGTTSGLELRYLLAALPPNELKSRLSQ